MILSARFAVRIWCLNLAAADAVAAQADVAAAMAAIATACDDDDYNDHDNDYNDNNNNNIRSGGRRCRNEFRLAFVVLLAFWAQCFSEIVMRANVEVIYDLGI